MIQQGHAYAYGQGPARIKVIALDVPRNDGFVRVAKVLSNGWPAEPAWVDSNHLAPLPMAYFHGQIPQ